MKFKLFVYLFLVIFHLIELHFLFNYIFSYCQVCLILVNIVTF